MLHVKRLTQQPRTRQWPGLDVQHEFTEMIQHKREDGAHRSLLSGLPGVQLEHSDARQQLVHELDTRVGLD